MYGIYAFAFASGKPIEQWVMDCDVDYQAGLGRAYFTADPTQAMHFESFEAAFEYWRRPSTVKPLREDGKQNRPLCAVTMEIRKLPDTKES